MSYKNTQQSDNSLRGIQAQVSGQRRQAPSFSQTNSPNLPLQQFQSNQQNCIFTICYNGEPRQFALAGQLLREDEEFDPLPPLV